MAQMVGRGGRVVAVDIQPQMIENLQSKAQRAGVAAQVECRLAGPSAMGTKDLAGKVDFVLAFAVVHELPDAKGFFNESFVALKRGGRLLYSEPSNHIDKLEFEKSLNFARQAGFVLESIPMIKSNQSAVLMKRLP
jgi:SAM-dependent methyltransferase